MTSPSRMKDARWFALGALVSAISAGCGGEAPSPVSPDIPVLAVTFENNLETARACEFRGAVGSPREAKELGANLVIAVVFTEASHSTNGVMTSVRGMKGKAVRCPAAVLERLVGRAGRRSTRGGA